MYCYLFAVLESLGSLFNPTLLDRAYSLWCWHTGQTRGQYRDFQVLQNFTLTEPPVRLELTTYRLQGGCSTVELQGQELSLYTTEGLSASGTHPLDHRPAGRSAFTLQLLHVRPEADCFAGTLLDQLGFVSRQFGCSQSPGQEQLGRLEIKWPLDFKPDNNLLLPYGKLFRDGEGDRPRSRRTPVIRMRPRTKPKHSSELQSRLRVSFVTRLSSTARVHCDMSPDRLTDCPYRPCRKVILSALRKRTLYFIRRPVTLSAQVTPTDAVF